MSRSSAEESPSRHAARSCVTSEEFKDIIRWIVGSIRRAYGLYPAGQFTANFFDALMTIFAKNSRVK
jgi:hypothetical protein